MKKTVVIFLLFVAMSSTAYSQNETKKITSSIECQIDSVMKKYVVKGITVSSANGIVIKYATEFYLENGFLVVKKLNFFNIEKLVSFQLSKDIFEKTYTMDLIFN
jgi:hypothetical protein